MNVWEERWGFVSVHTCGRDPALARDPGERGGVQVQERYSGERIAEQGGDVYQGLLPGQAPRPAIEEVAA